MEVLVSTVVLSFQVLVLFWIHTEKYPIRVGRGSVIPHDALSQHLCWPIQMQHIWMMPAKSFTIFVQGSSVIGRRGSGEVRSKVTPSPLGTTHDQLLNSRVTAISEWIRYRPLFCSALAPVGTAASVPLIWIGCQLHYQPVPLQNTRWFLLPLVYLLLFNAMIRADITFGQSGDLLVMVPHAQPHREQSREEEANPALTKGNRWGGGDYGAKEEQTDSLLWQLIMGGPEWPTSRDLTLMTYPVDRSSMSKCARLESHVQRVSCLIMWPSITITTLFTWSNRKGRLTPAPGKECGGRKGSSRSRYVLTLHHLSHTH